MIDYGVRLIFIPVRSEFLTLVYQENYSEDEVAIIKRWELEDWLNKRKYVYSSGILKYRSIFINIKGYDYMLVPLASANNDWVERSYKYAIKFVKDNRDFYISYGFYDLTNYLYEKYIYVFLGSHND